MRSALVFGANGYLGRHICSALKNASISFVPTGFSELSKDGYSNYKQVDITCNDDLKQLNFNVDYVFMFAGLTGASADCKLAEKYTKVNVQGLKNLLDCCVENNSFPKLIYPSTRLVYKGAENIELEEGADKEPKTIYAKNKMECELMLEEYGKKFGLNYTIFRIGVPYGNLFDSSFSYGTISFLLKQAKNNNITLYGNGSLKRTYTSVNDISRVILKSLEILTTKNNTYNIGGETKSLVEVAEIFALKYQAKINFIPWAKDLLAVESGDTIFSDDKLQKDVGYSYLQKIESWIKELK